MPEGIVYNDPIYSTERANVEPLSIDETKRLVAKLNIILFTGRMSDKDKELLQRLVWEYENLRHYHAYSGGGNGN